MLPDNLEDFQTEFIVDPKHYLHIESSEKGKFSIQIKNVWVAILSHVFSYIILKIPHVFILKKEGLVNWCQNTVENYEGD